MITLADWDALNEVRRRQQEFIAPMSEIVDIDSCLVTDLLTTMGDMALCNEILRAELAEMKRQTSNRAKV